MQSRLLLLISILITSVSAHSQFKKGTRMIGATIGSGTFSSGTTDYGYPSTQGFSADNKNFNFNLTPSYGFFVNDNTVIGVSLLLNVSTQKVNNRSLTDTIFASSKASNTDIGLGLFGRYYLSAKALAPFLHAYFNGGTGFGNTSGFSFGQDAFGSYEDRYTGETLGRFFFNAGLNAGFTKMLNRNVGLDVFAGYVFSHTKNETKTRSTRIYGQTGIVVQEFRPTQTFNSNGVTLGVGLQVFLSRE